METDEHEDFIKLVIKQELKEDDFEIKEDVEYPPANVGQLSGMISIKYKPTNITISYKLFDSSWLAEFENSLKGNLYKTKP